MAAKSETRAEASGTKAASGPDENKAASSAASSAEKDVHRGNQHREAAEASEFHAATEEARKAAEKAEKAAQARSGADYGASSREAHQASGYRLTDAHYEVPKALERAKDLGNERGTKSQPRDKEEK
jgi:hypothetical protein